VAVSQHPTQYDGCPCPRRPKHDLVFQPPALLRGLRCLAALERTLGFILFAAVFSALRCTSINTVGPSPHGDRLRVVHPPASIHCGPCSMMRQHDSRSRAHFPFDTSFSPPTKRHSTSTSPFVQAFINHVSSGTRQQQRMQGKEYYFTNLPSVGAKTTQLNSKATFPMALPPSMISCAFLTPSSSSFSFCIQWHFTVPLSKNPLSISRILPWLSASTP
jgi:hypothetical protein